MKTSGQKAVDDLTILQIVRVALVLWLTLFSLSVFSQSRVQLINERLNDYRDAYPDIEFVLLNKSEDFDEIYPLSRSLGDTVVNLDYQHPEELRPQLIEVQEYRIELMLDEGVGSASLFGTPDARITSKPYSCLVTLNKSLLSNDRLAATRMMYNLEDEDMSMIPTEFYLDNKDFLLYAIDHEVFHCVDVYLNGFLYPQTFDPLKACNDRAVAELKAEVFSVMAHMSRADKSSTMLKNLANARTFSLLDWDVEHYTGDVINDLSGMGVQANPGIRAMIMDALAYEESVRPSYDEYLAFLTAAWVVTQQYGLDRHDIPEECHVLEDYEPDPKKIIELSADISDVLQVMNYSY